MRLQIDVGVSQCLLGNLVQTQIEQAHLQAAAHQKLHAEVVDLLGAGADSLGLELLVVLTHHLAADQSQRAVDLLLGGNVQLHTVLTGELVLKNFAKFFFVVISELLSAHTLVLFMKYRNREFLLFPSPCYHNKNIIISSIRKSKEKRRFLP